jgi:hypothetical protein
MGKTNKRQMVFRDPLTVTIFFNTNLSEMKKAESGGGNMHIYHGSVSYLSVLVQSEIKGK